MRAMPGGEASEPRLALAAGPSSDLLGFVACLGIGIVGEGPALLVALVAGAVVFLPAAGLVAPLGEKRFAALPVVAAVWSALLLLMFQVRFRGQDDALAAGARFWGRGRDGACSGTRTDGG